MYFTDLPGSTENEINTEQFRHNENRGKSAVSYDIILRQNTPGYFHPDPVYNDPLLYTQLTRILLLSHTTNTTVLQNRPEWPSTSHRDCSAGVPAIESAVRWPPGLLVTETEIKKL